MAAPSNAEADRRGFFRVTARIPIRVRTVDRGEAAGLAVEIAGPHVESVGIADPAIANVLFRLEEKIDRVLAALDHNVLPPLWDGDAHDVSISASGVGLDSGKPFDPESQVLVEFLLPERPKRHVRALARPVDGGGAQPQAFAFEVIAETDRDAIVRFSQDVQRLNLRQRTSS